MTVITRSGLYSIVHRVVCQDLLSGFVPLTDPDYVTWFVSTFLMLVGFTQEINVYDMHQFGLSSNQPTDCDMTETFKSGIEPWSVSIPPEKRVFL